MPQSRAAVLALLLAATAAAQDSPPPAEPTPPAAPAPTPPPANDGPPIGGLGPGGGRGAPGYSAVWYPSRPVSGSAADLGFVRQNLSLGMPVWRDGGDLLLASLTVRNTLFSTAAVLPDSGRPFPGELWNVNLGANYIHQFERGWTGGFGLTVGSASDKPFHSIDEVNVNLFGFLRTPAWNERDSWLFSLFYSPLGAVNFPIPGVAYVWVPSDAWKVTIGLPFAVHWQPVEAVSLDLSYVPLTNVNAKLTYKPCEPLSLYGGFEWLNEGYLLANRPEVRDRFLSFEKRLVGGVCWTFRPGLVLDCSAGYAFDRYFGEGRGSGTQVRDRVDVAPGAFLGAGLRFKF